MVLGAGDRNKEKVVISEKFCPTGLSAVEYFGRHEALQISMIRENLDGVTRSFKIMAPMSHGFNDG